MYRLLIICALLICNLSVIAQAKPIYFNRNQIVTDSSKATSYGVFGKVLVDNEELWVLKRYSLYDELLNTGSFKDKELTIEHGDFVYYSYVQDFNNQNLTSFTLKDSFRFKSQKGTFKNGLEEGKWTWFYPNGKIMTILTYQKGIKHGPFVNYNRNGYLEQSGNYVNGEKDGEWRYNKGKDSEFYIMGQRQKTDKSKTKASKSNATIN